ncbi:MAG: Prophage integrase [Bacteroidota bacterium]|jgi:integrase
MITKKSTDSLQTASPEDERGSNRRRVRFTARWVTTVSNPGCYYDASAPGLALQVTTGKSGLCKSYKFLFRSPVTGKRRDKGLGPATRIALSDARQKALAYREMIGRRIDPLTAAAEEKAARLRMHETSISFGEAANRCIEAKAPEWRNKKHGQQWKNTLATHAQSLTGLPVRDVDSAAVLRVLEPIWTSKPETASRVRQRIEAVLDWAAARNYRSGDNPARLKGNLGPLLPKTSKIKRVQHHPALPIDRANEFIQALRAKPSVSAHALEFLILTAARTSEVRLASWDEFNLDTRVWTIPASRMKSGRQHRVPLSDRATEILQIRSRLSSSNFTFPGQDKKGERGLSDGALLQLIRGIPGYEAYVPHGFRSTFRDWAAERTTYANETVELALAHTIRNQTESSYRRGDQLEKRRRLMQAWSNFLETPKLIRKSPIISISSRA